MPKEILKKIYLQIGDHNYDDLDHEEVTWCQDRINGNDIVYYSREILDAAVKEERESCIIECVKVANKYEGKYLDDVERENYIGMLSAEICAEAIRNRNKEII